jgi:hypothetical protein
LNSGLPYSKPTRYYLSHAPKNPLFLGKDNKGTAQLIVKLKDLRQGKFQLRWDYSK